MGSGSSQVVVMSQTYLYLDPQFAPTFARVLGFDAFVSGSQRARARGRPVATLSSTHAFTVLKRPCA